MKKKLEEDFKFNADTEEESTGTTTTGFGKKNPSSVSDGKIAATNTTESATTIEFGSAAG